MPKKNEKSKESKKVPESSKTTSTEPAVEVGAITSSADVVPKTEKVSKLVPSFGNGELNQVVEKLNEVIEVINTCQ